MQTRKVQVYFASPLFTPQELRWNEAIAKLFVEWGYQVFLPQRDVGCLPDLVRKGMSAEEASKQVAAADIDGIHSSQLVFANLNGVVVDAGVAGELGRASGLNLPRISFKDDGHRFSRLCELNPMVRRLAGTVTRTIPQLREALHQESRIYFK